MCGTIIFIIWKGIFSDLENIEDIVKEVAVAPSDEGKELGEEGVIEDTENGSKGIEEMIDGEDCVIVINTCFI